MRAWWLLLLVLLTPVGPAGANGGIEALREPGAVAIMRHALAPGTGDPSSFRLDDCSTQRNLNEAGRQQARRLGEAIRTAGIEFDRVLTSQWCRCRDTADELALAPVEDFPPLNSFFRDRSKRGPQTAALRAFLTELPADERVLLVTHQVNITALTGRGVRSGELFVLQLDAEGNVQVVAEVETPAG